MAGLVDLNRPLRPGIGVSTIRAVSDGGHSQPRGEDLWRVCSWMGIGERISAPRKSHLENCLGKELPVAAVR